VEPVGEDAMTVGGDASASGCATSGAFLHSCGHTSPFVSRRFPVSRRPLRGAFEDHYGTQVFRIAIGDTLAHITLYRYGLEYPPALFAGWP
jgi:hypothetical protein